MGRFLGIGSVVARASVAGAGGVLDERLFRQAVRVANPQLADRLDARDTAGAVEGPRLARTRAAYRLRAQHRPTPFGLFAGIGPMQIAESGPVVRPGEPVGFLRPASEWLDRVIVAFESDASVLFGMQVALRHPFSVHGDRVYRPARRSVEVGFERSVRYTPVLRQVIWSLLDGPRRVDELYDLLDGLALPQKPDHVEFAGYVAQLIDAGLLVSQLRPASSSTTPLPDIAVALRERCPAAAAAVLELHRGMGLVPMTEVLDRIETLQARCGDLPPVPGAGAALVQVDTVYQQAGSIPANLLRQAVRHACALDRIALRGGMTAPLRAWHRDLVEQFGAGRPVPLLVAIDPVSGIGLPGWGTAPESASEEPGHRDLCRALLGRTGPYADGTPQVVLVDDDLPGPVDTPHPGRDVCLDVYFQRDGRFMLAPAAVGGSAAPGAFSGRLRAALDAVTGNGATTVLRRLVPAASRVLDFRAQNPRSGNVNRPTDVHSAAVAIDHVPIRPADLALSDVALLATLDDVTVCDTAGEPVSVSYSAILNRDSMPGVVRLLLEIADCRGPRWAPWSWGAFASLPRTPRVVYGDVVVCRAQWSVPDELRSAAGGPGFGSSVQRWRAQCAVPEIVQVSNGTDQLLPLNIATDPTHLAILEKLMRQDGPITVQEDLLSELTRGWGHADHMQLVLSMSAGAAPRARR